MVQPELTALTLQDSELPRPGLGGRALGAALFLATLVCFSFAFVNAAHAAGIAGTHGTLTVEKCWQDKGSRRSGGHTVCSGIFRSDDGKSVDEMAQASAKFEPGSRVSVQQSSDRYVRTGFGEVACWIAFFFGGWLLAASAMAIAVTGMLPRSGTQVPMVLRSITSTRAARCGSGSSGSGWPARRSSST